MKQRGVIGIIIVLGILITGVIFLVIYNQYTHNKINTNSSEIVSPTVSENTIPSLYPTEKVVSKVSNISSSGKSGWNTYTHYLMKISFDFPNTYNIMSEGESHVDIVSPLNEIRDSKSDSALNGELKLEFGKEDSIADDNPDKCFFDHADPSTKIVKTNISVGGVNTTKISWELLADGDFICLIRNGYRFTINKYPHITIRENEYNEILSSFKFVE